MIITLKGATFTHKLNLNVWLVNSSLVGVDSSNTASSVTKDGSYITTFTIRSGFKIDADSTVSVVCNGQTYPLSWSSTEAGGTASLKIDKVTAPITITVKASTVSGTVVDPDTGGDNGDTTSSYTLIHGNKYASGNEENTARASISPLTIIVPAGVTITNKSTIKWAYYTNVDTSNMPSGSGIGSWGDYTYTGTGAAIGISFKKVDDSAFDWSVDSTNPADYFDVSDEGLWDGTAEGTTPEPEEPSNPEGTLGDITTIILVNGNPYGTAEQQAAANRVHSETALYAPAGTVISCKDTTTYKWALRRVKSETNLSDAGDAYKPDAGWTTKTSYTTTVNGYWCFILLKASNADFDWSVDSNKVSDYFTVS